MTIKRFAQNNDPDDPRYLSEQARSVLKIDTLEAEIRQRLEELKNRYHQAQRRKLLPAIVKGDFLSSTNLLEDDDEEQGDATMPVNIANRKSKIGVIFGTDVKKGFGHKVKVKDQERIIVAKIFGLTQGEIHRTRIQAAWANSLQDFYGNLLKGTENESIYREAYAAQFNEITELLNQSIERVEDSIENSEEKRRKIRSLKGATLLALVPDELKKRFIMDMTNSYLQVSKKNCSGTVLATFVVQEDPFPYVWQPPKGADVVPRFDSERFSEVFDTDRELMIEWDSESSRERYFPEGLWEGDTDTQGNPVTVRKEFLGQSETGETEMQSVEIPVYSMRKNPEYQKQQTSFEEQIKNYQRYAQLDASLRFAEIEAASKAEGQEVAHKKLIDTIENLFNGLVEKGEKGVNLSFGGILAYVANMRLVSKRHNVLEVIRLFKEANQAKKANDKAEQQEKMSQLKKVVGRSFYDREVDSKEALKLAFVFTKAHDMPEADDLVKGNYPKSVYDPNVYNKQVLPSSKSNVSLEMSHPETGEIVNVRVNAQKNPFYTPKMWPTEFTRADTGWPGSGASALKSKSIMLTQWRQLPWQTFTLEQKRDNIAKMKEQLARLEEEEADGVVSKERKRLINDLKIVEEALFMDELRTYVKMNLAFNIDDPESPSPASKVESAPSLFYFKRDGQLYNVELSDLVDPRRLQVLRNQFGVEPGQPIDVTNDAESNYGMMYDMPTPVQKLLQKQLRKTQASSIVKRLKRLAASEEDFELFFDLDGNEYSSEHELEQALIAKGSPYTLEDKVEIANMLRETAGEMIASDDETIPLLTEIQEALEVVGSQEEEPEPPSPQDMRLEIPGDTDQEELPYIEFPQQEAQPVDQDVPIAAKLHKPSIKGFTSKQSISCIDDLRRLVNTQLKQPLRGIT